MKMKRKTSLGAIVGTVLTCASVAYASDWVNVGTANIPQHPKCVAPYAIDTATWKHTDNVLTAWGKEEYGPNYAACGGTYRVASTKTDYDCDNRTYHNLYIMVETWAGVRSSEDVSDGPTDPVIPDSVGESELDFVCNALAKQRAKK
jgi:hypothetical protein